MHHERIIRYEIAEFTKMNFAREVNMDIG